MFVTCSAYLFPYYAVYEDKVLKPIEPIKGLMEHEKPESGTGGSEYYAGWLGEEGWKGGGSKEIMSLL